MLSLRVILGLELFNSLSVSCFHQLGYALVLALISRMDSVGGMTFWSNVARREADGLMKDDDVVDEEGETAG